MQKFTDHQIINGLQTRNARNIEAIVRFLYKECYESIEKMVAYNRGTKADADDLFQDVIVAFLENTWDGKFVLRENTRVKTYIYEIAHLMWLKELKKRTAREQREARYSSAMNLYDEDAEKSSEFIEELFMKLPDRCQKILYKFYFEKKTMKEISSELKMSEDAAKTQKYRCTSALKKLI